MALTKLVQVVEASPREVFPREQGLSEELAALLLRLLKTEREDLVRTAAARELQAFAPARPEVARALVDALRDASPEVGRQAAASLARRGVTTGTVVPGLVAAVVDTTLDEAVRGQVALTLGMLRERVAVPVLARLLEQPDESFLTGFDEVTGLSDTLRPMKMELVEALQAMGPLALEAVPALLRCVRMGRGMHQCEAAQVVERLGTAREELEALLCEVLPQAESWVRPGLREVLSRLEPTSEGAVRALVGALLDETETRESARRNLSRAVRARPELIEHIEPLTHDENPRMRSAAHEALGALGRPTTEFLERLSQRLESEDPHEREEAVASLRRLGSRAAGVRRGLLERLPRLGAASRAAVMSVIVPVSGETPDAASCEALEAGLGDPDAGVREAAVWALADLPGLDAGWVRRVDGLRTDAAPGVREAVAVMLRAKGSLPVGATTSEQATRSVRELSFTMYAALREGAGNRVFSPLSVFILLALVLRATRGSTEEALRRALYWPLAPSRLFTALSDLTEKLHERGDEGAALVSANGFWPQEGYPVHEEYLAELREAFGVIPTAVDFAGAPDAASRVINGWVHERTHGRIPAIVDPKGESAFTRFVLANTVYFRSQWEQPFEEDSTREAPFHLLGGQQVEGAMMRREGRFGYTRGAGYQLIELPYRGRQTSMVVLLPDTGFFERFERLLSGERLEELLAGLSREHFVLRMPRFHFGQSVDLTQLAERLRLSAMFAPDADLSGMSPRRELFRGLLLHDAALTVDEKGTEAAAATRLSHIGGVPREVVVDRPFLFLLRHLKTGTVLFLGRVVDPSPPSTA